jgi:hypothetical protein
MMRNCLTVTLVAAILLIISSYRVSAAPQRSVPAPAEDLGDRLLGDLALPPVPAPQEQPPSRLVPGVDESRDQLRPAPASEGGEGIGKAGESPLARISDRMSKAGRLIAAQVTDGETRKVQDEIVNDLDALIEELSKQCKNCSSGQCENPGQQQQTSQSKPKPGEGKKPGSPNQAQNAAQQSQVPTGGGKPSNPGELSDQELLKQLWGQLPQHMRQQLLQSSADEFLPKYRADLEEYFRKLSEDERSAPEDR